MNEITPPPPLETKPNTELLKTAGVGRLVVQTATERQNPKYLRERYSMPMLNPAELPQGAVKTVKTLSIEGKLADEKVVKGASLALAIEASAQVVEARHTSSQIREHTDSLEQVLKMTRAGATLLKEMEASDQDLVLVAAKTAIDKRIANGTLKDTDMSDEEVFQWSRKIVNLANQRIGKSIQALSAYRY